jgi:hypothetical protein
MKAHLAELVRASPTPAHGRNVAREYLQARILGSLQRTGAMIPLAFHGKKPESLSASAGEERPPEHSSR